MRKAVGMGPYFSPLLVHQVPFKTRPSTFLPVDGSTGPLHSTRGTGISLENKCF